jgi:alkanesulfonate monooxygenase SsuD/methylene tetrahydromethanopterin reductase-like flavin-dependent oxidoreductase (luciferase family)
LALDATWVARVEAALARSRGWYFDLDRYDDPEIDLLVDDDLVRRFAIAGTPDECVALAKEVLAHGFTSASFNLAAPLRPSLYEGLAEVLDHSGEVLDGLR